MRHCVVVLVFGGCATAAAPGNPTGTDAAIDAAIADAAPSIDAPLTFDAAPDAPMGGSCASVTTCAGATALMSVSGDTGSQVITSSDYRSTWYSVRVSEDDSGVFAIPMGIRAELTSPAGSNFDLFVYVNTGSDVVSCTTPSASSTNAAGTFDSALVTWGESGTFSNGSNDDRTVSIEVRAAASTACAASAPWQLTVYGNQ
ncbi:hypothetical protein BH11MYX2_BH11MYX2_31480 [soil metagenome]